MIWIAVCLVAGAVMLYFGSEWLVRGAKGLALRLGVSPFVIGLTIVAFGSSAPECITSVVSTDEPSIIIGNVVGSNIANVGMAIGLAALAGPMAAKYESMRIEISAMIATAVGLCALGFMGDVGRISGICMIALLFVFLYVVFTSKKSDDSGKEMYESDSSEPDQMKTWLLCVLCVVGMVLLYFGAKYFIAGAKDLAELIGVSDLVIGLVVVAIGTSLPEICISTLAARKGEADLAVANIVGSNIFNILFVLGIGAVLVDVPITDSVLTFHLPVMLLFSVAMYLVVRSKGRIDRPIGAVFVGMYACYIGIMAMVPSLMMRSENYDKGARAPVLTPSAQLRHGGGIGDSEGRSDAGHGLRIVCGKPLQHLGLHILWLILFLLVRQLEGEMSADAEDDDDSQHDDALDLVIQIHDRENI